MFPKLTKGRHTPPDQVRTDVHRLVPTDAIRPFGRMPQVEFVSPFLSHLHMEDGPMFDPYKIPGSRSLHERKMATWALLIGETYSSAVHAETRRRPHRGMLPDVDFSRAVPDHSRPSLVRRIVRMMRPGRKGHADDSFSAAKAGSSASPAKPVGETPATTYIERSRADDTGDSVSSARADARPNSLVHQSRAA
jgi:hypothetical protein